MYHGDYGDVTDLENPNAFVCGVYVNIVHHTYKSVTVLDNETSVRMLNGGKVLDAVIDCVLKNQSLNIDAVSGATATTNVILKSIENALSDNKFEKER